MALLLTMPVAGTTAQEFEPERFDAMSGERSGRVGGVTLGRPLWKAKWGFNANLEPAAAENLRAFFARLRGGQRAFLTHDRSRAFPAAYPGGFGGMVKAGGGAFTGACSGWSQAIDANGDAAITLSGLPANFALSLNDYIGLKWDAAGSSAGSYDRRALARVVVATVGSGAGVASAIVEPPIDTLVVPAGAVAYLDTPACRMKLLSGESSLGALGTMMKIEGGTISAIEDLRP
ncbi:hypothetical protein FSZ31_04405 [Sphingorhabdus soli]|uniref:Uncharacterized protein n=1 Tax=Flavisphingopyxis soli TaxID=2601267 RepID=A0A5C6UM51_9SPHN|nr:hypothetical protein [Sphingorhabdus soli]TXC73969.1 hypothetical protein FSZ31_04405 [Sphingorhabdus soli]